MEALIGTFVVAVTAVVCLCVVHPIGVEVFGRKMEVNFVTASLGSVLLLHFLDIISLRFMVDCIQFSGHVQPWAVLVIFFTLAYASISLDVTGLSKYVALRVLRDVSVQPTSSKASSISPGDQLPPQNLLVVVFLLSGFLSVVASNDVVILTLTPVLIHFCELSMLDPLPVLLAEYFAANTFSALLLVGNPTNIIVGQGLGISFLPYVLLLAVPTFVTATAIAALLWMFDVETWYTGNAHKGMQEEQSRHDVAAREELPVDSAFVLVCHSSPTCTIETERRSDLLINPSLALKDPSGAIYGASVLSTGILCLMVCGYVSVPMYMITIAMCSGMILHDLTKRSTELDKSENLGSWWCTSRLRQVCLRMPWEVAPFAVCMFILVSALDAVRVTPRLTDAVVSVSKATGPVGSAFVGMAVVIAAMNMLNNQPATILMVNVLLGRNNTLRSSHPQEFACWTLALILGSNVAAAFTLRGALAGTMWEAILVHHNVEIDWRKFSKAGVVLCGVPCVLAAAAVCITAAFAPAKLFGSMW